LGGGALTLTLAVIGIIVSIILGFLIGYLRFADPRPLRWLAAPNVEFLRNVPLLILIFWAYFMPPCFNVVPSTFASVLPALILFLVLPSVRRVGQRRR
jgi:His/Glu/Gln/Arg/opine family amino acid ABC transporter permease subunit